MNFLYKLLKLNNGDIGNNIYKATNMPFFVMYNTRCGLQSLICLIESTAGIRSPASFLISYNIVILHFMKNERSSYMHALRAYFFILLVFEKCRQIKALE